MVLVIILITFIFGSIFYHNHSHFVSGYHVRTSCYLGSVSWVGMVDYWFHMAVCMVDLLFLSK